MCDTQPVSIDGALAMLDRALDTLNTADAASLPTLTQARMLRALGRAESPSTLPPVPGCWRRSPPRTGTTTMGMAAHGRG